MISGVRRYQREGAGLLAARPAEILVGVVECDEIYVTAGHKGQPAAVAKKLARGASAA